MGKRVWKVKWRARSAPDGEERLSRAVRLLLEAARSASSARRTGPGAASCSQEPRGEEDAQEEGGHDRMWNEAGGGAVLEDEVEYALPVGVLGRVVGGGYARHQLERMFAYRHAVTRADVRRHAAFAEESRLTVALSGASGLVGSALKPFLTTGGHRVRRLVRVVLSLPLAEVESNVREGVMISPR